MGIDAGEGTVEANNTQRDVARDTPITQPTTESPPGAETTPTQLPDTEQTPKPSKKDLPLVILDEAGNPQTASIEDILYSKNLGYTISSEAWELYKQAVDENHPMSVAQAIEYMKVIAACYTIDSKSGKLKPLQGGISPTQSTEQTASSEFLLQQEKATSEDIRAMAAALHEGYQQYHRRYEQAIKEILREYHTDNNIEIIDLLRTSFENLPKEWKDVNETSASNILYILDLLLPESITGGDIVQKLAAIQDPKLIYDLNSALYAIWSQRPEKSTDGKKHNPLFHCNSYDEFKRISRPDGEPDSGWPAFLESYRQFLKQNKDTYGRVMATRKNGDTSGEASIGFFAPGVGEIDTDKAGEEGYQEIDDAEIDNFDDSKLIEMIRAQARSELFKDAYMMEYFLTKYLLGS